MLKTSNTIDSPVADELLKFMSLSLKPDNDSYDATLCALVALASGLTDAGHFL